MSSFEKKYGTKSRKSDVYEKERRKIQNEPSQKPKKGVVEPNVAAYYQRCLSVLKEDAFDTENDKKLFVSTVFETLSVDGFKVLQSQTLSRIIESFLEYADFSLLNVILDIFKKNWDSSSCDWFAHRCLEKTIEVYQTLVATQDEDALGFKAAAFKMSDFGSHMYEHYPQYIQHERASHIVRAYLKLLCGIRIKVVGASESVEVLKEGLPNGRLVMKSLAQTFLYSPHLRVSIEDPYTNLFIQTVITCLHYRFPKKFKNVVKHLLHNSKFFESNQEEGDETNRLPYVFNCRQGSYFLERLIRYMSDKHFEAFHEAYIRDHVLTMALSGTGSFILQRVVERSDNVLFLHLTRTLAPQFPSIFGSNQVGIMMALVDRACTAVEAQKQLVSALRRCLQCNGEDPKANAAFIGCLCYLHMFRNDMQSNDQENQSDRKVSYHGSRMTQSILKYNKTGFIVKSFLNVELNELLQLATDCTGCFVFDALFASINVSQDLKLQIVERMKPVICRISCNKYGSRIMDTLWMHLDNDGRYKVTQILAEFKDKLSSDRFGHFVHRKYSLGNFHRKRDWKTFNSKKTPSLSEKKRKVT